MLAAATREADFRSADEAARRADAEHFFPARPGVRDFAVERAIDDEVRHLFDDMFEIKFGDAIAFEIGRGIQEVDRPGHAVFDREFDRIHFVAERLIDGACVVHDAGAEIFRKIVVLDEVAAFFGIVANRQDVGLAEGEAADIALEVDEFLERHAVRRGLIVGGEQLLFVVHLVDVLPSAAGETASRSQAGRRSRVSPSQSTGYFRLCSDSAVMSTSFG